MRPPRRDPPRLYAHFIGQNKTRGRPRREGDGHAISWGLDAGEHAAHTDLGPSYLTLQPDQFSISLCIPGNSPCN